MKEEEENKINQATKNWKGKPKRNEKRKKQQEQKFEEEKAEQRTVTT